MAPCPVQLFLLTQKTWIVTGRRLSTWIQTFLETVSIDGAASNLLEMDYEGQLLWRDIINTLQVSLFPEDLERSSSLCLGFILNNCSCLLHNCSIVSPFPLNYCDNRIYILTILSCFFHYFLAVSPPSFPFLLLLYMKWK